MARVFTWRIWRLAWGRDKFDAIGGWRRLWWRFWWRLKREPIACRSCGKPVEEARRVYVVPTCYACLPPPPALPVVNIAKTKSWMHWSPDPTGKPFCGEPLLRWTLWTMEYDYVTCPACIRRGSPLVLQHWANTR